MSFEDLKRMLEDKKKVVVSDEDKHKVETIEKIFNYGETCFFNIDKYTAVGILNFLGVPVNEIKSVYFSLISTDVYKKLPKERIDISGSLKR